MSPLFVALVGVAMLGLGLYGIRDFRHWNAQRTGSVRARDFLAMVFGVMAFPGLVILGALLAVDGLLGFPT